MRGRARAAVVLALVLSAARETSARVGIEAAIEAGFEEGQQDAGDSGSAALAEVVRLREAGRFAQALSAAEAIADPARAAEARLYVAWHAGDLGGALRAGLAGLERAPEDLPLLWASLRLAVDLSAAEIAARLERELAAALAEPAGIEGPAHEEWIAAQRTLSAAAQELQASARARARSLTRAQAVVGAGGVLVLSLVWFLGRKGGAAGVRRAA